MNAEWQFKRVQQLDKALRLMGDTHAVADVIAMVHAGTMQSFVHGSSWALTEMFDFPRKRVCQIFLAMGDLAELMVLHDKILAFAKAEGCTLLRSIGRPGWRIFADENEWTLGAQVYLKEIP